jgi:hypothetical protein
VDVKKDAPHKQGTFSLIKSLDAYFALSLVAGADDGAPGFDGAP